MRAFERFLQYIAIDTASSEAVETCPSSENQWTIARGLVAELRALGCADARVDEHCYVYASIPENTPGQRAIGLIAHMDTVDNVPRLPMRPRIIEDYDGKDILLNDEGVSIPVAQYPQMASFRGEHLIVTDGRTLLGADDKAGVAEIMTLVERIAADKAIPHGKICVAFTPDEEIGRGADLFDVAAFGADYAYTVDGDLVGVIEQENFNAASGQVTVHGLNIHPGSAKGIMKNAALIAAEFINLLPAWETPAHTEGYEGFYHLCGMSGAEEEAELHYIIRDHDETMFESRKRVFQSVADFLNIRYGAGTVEAVVTDGYQNMLSVLEKHPEIVERAKDAMRACGVTPVVKPIRGGTDGSRLSFMGLPCPNLSTGGTNMHGRRECISIEAMDRMVEVLLALVRAR